MVRQRILIVEDDPFIAMDIEAAVLEDLGPRTEVIVVDSLREAQAVAVDAVDCALLDVDVVGGKTFEVALKLREHGTPFAFVSGSLPSDLPAELTGATFVRKPFHSRDILGFVSAAIASREVMDAGEAMETTPAEPVGGPLSGS
ncbi:MAG: two component response regulator [Xanthobacteraceae bacterium]|nr:MAG: two component response regulator [Xanthobacteraceae bacterium]